MTARPRSRPSPEHFRPGTSRSLHLPRPFLPGAPPRHPLASRPRVTFARVRRACVRVYIFSFLYFTFLGHLAVSLVPVFISSPARERGNVMMGWNGEREQLEICFMDTESNPFCFGFICALYAFVFINITAHATPKALFITFTTVTPLALSTFKIIGKQLTSNYGPTVLTNIIENELINDILG